VVAVTLTGVGWRPADASDIHLLPGLVSPRLDHLLRVSDTRDPPDQTRRADDPHPGVSVAFTAQFESAPSAHGVTLDEATGEITIALSLPARRLRSFLVTATATQAGQPPQRTRIRVNVHDGIERLWLTPNPLTVREGFTSTQLSLLARFTDEVIGDISNWSPFLRPAATTDRTFVHRSTTAVPLLVWAKADPSATAVDVDDVTGQLFARGPGGGENITVRGAPSPNPDPTARVDCAPAWSTTPVKLSKANGSDFRTMASRRNILFLPEGFKDFPDDRERKAFEKLAQEVAKLLSTRKRVRPFDKVSGRLNYFTAWVPSRDAGVSVLNELDRVDKTATTADGYELEEPSLAGGGAGTWSLEDLIHEVGLPTPKHDPDSSPLNAARIQNWQALYGLHITATRMGHLYADWRGRNDRVLLNERDTAFHVAMSSRPRVDGSSAARDLALNPRRIRGEDLDEFLNALRDENGATLPVLPWATGGQDDDLVVILCRTNRIGGLNAARRSGQNIGHTLAVSLRDDEAHHIQANPGGNGFDLQPDPIPRAAHIDTWTTVAHELAHSWTLADEYGGNLPLDAALRKAVGKANVQPRSELLDSSNKLVSKDIRWRWPRLAKAGELAADPVPTGAEFRLQLVAPHTGLPGRDDAFVIGDIVRLRRWPLLEAGDPTGRFKVVDVDYGLETMQIEPLAGTILFPLWYLGFKDGIVMVPRRAPDPDAAHDVYGDDLELVAGSVRARIDATNNPLNAMPQPLEPKNRPCTDVELPTPTLANNFPNGKAPRPPRFSSWIVGLYENATETNCGVYRPTGICLMHQNLFRGPKGDRARAYQFCWVCRYVLVDLLDPSQHHAIDLDYEPEYPA
jgi:hypothetical protein